MVKVGDKVRVEFITANRTEFDGACFVGVGVVDLVSEGYVYGRCDDGRTFMCNLCDVEVLDV